MTKFILIEPSNFIDFPIGGQLSFAKQLMQAFGNEIALVGYSHKNEPTGKWYKKVFDGIEYDYFGIRYIPNTDSKPWIPLRIQNLLWFYIRIHKILAYENSFWFIQAPEILIPATRFKKSGITYMFPGVTNPLDIPRYRWGKIFASSFYNQFLKSLQKTELRVACADEDAIKGLRERTQHYLTDLSIDHFPTRYDSSIFFPVPQATVRKALDIPDDKTVIVCCGRINEVKGWQLVFDSYCHFRKSHQDSLLIFIGDGEDKAELLDKVNKNNLQENVLITGFQPAEKVAQYINCGDIALVGSIREGWSVSMLETLACGKAIVSTDVSGATTMIKQGQNGYVVKNRDPKEFSKCIQKSLDLENVSKISTSIAGNYTLSALRSDLLTLWKQLDS